MSAASTARRGPEHTIALMASSSTIASPNRSFTWRTGPTPVFRSTTWRVDSRRSFGDGFLTTPSGFATYGDLMIIAELRARLAVTDMNDDLLTYIGDNQQVCDVEGLAQQYGR